jgi:hypothetical protein
MYDSPFHLYFEKTARQIAGQTDEAVWREVERLGVTVDRDELIRALKYDRGQYDKGYADGKAAAMDELVRCKDCKHRGKKIEYGFVAYAYESVCPLCCDDDPYYSILKDDDFFCAYGERRSDD